MTAPTATAEAPTEPRGYDPDPIHSYGLITPRFWHGMLPLDYLRQLARNRFQVSPRGAFSSSTIVAVGCGHLVARAVQQLRYGRRIERVRVNKEPLFVLGHWRSGTTMLHELLIRDPRNTFPTTYECFTPHGFLTSERWVTPLIGWLLPDKRPMDNVPAGWDRPQEDEFAMCSLGFPSPYRSWMFPQHGPVDHDWLTLENVPAADRERWKKALRRFVQALTLMRLGGRVVLKSPPHTARVKTLLEVFPDARFVHITRDPHVLFPSTVRLWRTLCQVQGMQLPKQHYGWIEEEVLANLVTMYDAFERDRELIPDGHLAELRYEELVEDPKRELRAIYDTLSLRGFDAAEPQVDAYLAEQRGYRTNRYEVPDDIRRIVADRWGAYAQRYGYA